MITGKELGGLLFSIHKHDPNTEEIIYTEKELLPILRAIGLPEPEWGECIKVEEFLSNKKNELKELEERLQFIKKHISND